MKTIHPFIKGLLITSFLFSILNVATPYIPAFSDAPILMRMWDVLLYTTFVLTVLGVFHTVFFLLEEDSLVDFDLGLIFYLLIPFINIISILLFLHLLLGQLPSSGM